MTDRPDLRPPDPGNEPDLAPEGSPDGGDEPGLEPIDPASTAGPSAPPPPPEATSADAAPPPPPMPAAPSMPPTPPTSAASSEPLATPPSAPPDDGVPAAGAPDSGAGAAPATADDTARPTVDAPPTAPPPPPPVAPPGPIEPDAGDAPAKPSPWKAVALIGAVLLVGLGAFFLLKDDGETAAPAATSTTIATGDDFIKVRDAQAGFSVEHPESWKPLREADGEERLLLTAGGQNYFQLKVRAVDPATAGAEIQTALEGLEMLTEPRSVTLSGQPATLYLYYTPVTEASPVKGVHVHYFVLQGERLFSLVFQALPAENLNDLVPVFDRVAKSFTIEASTAPPAGDTTTTTG